MKIVKPSFQIETSIDQKRILKQIERAGRTAYKSEDKISDESAKDFVSMIIRLGHESVLEHFSITVRLIADRGVTHEIVRHRIASYTQESTRYCNYSKGKFGGEITVIEPFFWEKGSEKYRLWEKAMKDAEESYIELIRQGASPQEARSVLPNSLKTEIVMTMNLRQWRHFFRLRTHASSHPQMRQVVIPLLDELKRILPSVFDDINVK